MFGELFEKGKRMAVKQRPSGVVALTDEEPVLNARLNWKRGVEVNATILDLYQKKLPPFDRPEAVLPQDPAHMPKTLELGSRMHRLFLFHVNYYMRGGVDSNTAVKMLAQVFDKFPHYFDPYYAAYCLSPARLGRALQDVGLNYRKSQTPLFWIENARRMFHRYGCDPINIFKGMTTYEVACSRIQNDHKGNGFKGFQKKMVSMVVYFFMHAGFISPFKFPIPVDIHVTRINLANQVVRIPKKARDMNLVRDERVLDLIRSFYSWYSMEFDVNTVELCDAVWMYSRLMCTYNPENEWQRLGKHLNRKSKIKKKPVNWQDIKVLERWVAACGSCPLNDTCVENVPAMPYYVHGSIRLNDPRTGPIDPPSLFELDELVALFRRKVRPNAKKASRKECVDQNQLTIL